MLSLTNYKLYYSFWEKYKVNATKNSNTALDVSMYPNAKEGFKREIIALKPTHNDHDNFIEIYAGKKMLVDCYIISHSL